VHVAQAISLRVTLIAVRARTQTNSLRYNQAMSVEITFEQDGGSGLVAAGSSLWDAARRLGVGLRADCRGRGECDACAVLIVKGAELLCPVKESEYKVLGAERVAAGERLACQTTLVKPGEVTARVMPVAKSAGKTEKSEKAFSSLPLKQQVGAFIETEAKVISKAVNMLRGKSNALVEKFLNLNQEKPGPGSKAGDNKPPTV
jgi:ferredoxin